MRRTPCLRGCLVEAASVAVAIALAGCGTPGASPEPPAHTARVWKDPQATVSFMAATATPVPLLSEIPVAVLPSSFHASASSAAPGPPPETPRIAAPAVLAEDPPRPVEIPWASPPEAEAPPDSTDDAEGEVSLPVRLAGPVRTVAPRGPSAFPAGLRPGPCCLKYPARCAELTAQAKIEGTLASRAVQSLQMRATPFGKSRP